jgi:hypothetical protein
LRGRPYGKNNVDIFFTSNLGSLTSEAIYKSLGVFIWAGARLDELEMLHGLIPH